MAANDSPEELPAGWTLLFKVLRTGRKVTIYTNLETRKRFFSKDDLFKYIKAGSSHADKPPPADKDRENYAVSTSLQASDKSFFGPPPTSKDGERNAESTSLQPEPGNKKNELPKWLPDGWKVEVRVRKSGVHNGKEYKCYFDPLNQGKFYSKLEVLRYLKTVRCKKSVCKDVTVNNKDSVLEKKTGSSMHSANKVVVQKCEAEDLPSGWIKEIKIRQSSNTIRKDPFYTDPVSGYVFRSKKDALRYVQTGEISRHAFKPKNPPKDAPELMSNEILTSAAAKRQKLEHPQSRRQLFAGKKGSEMGDLELSKTQGSKISSAKVSPKARVTVSFGDEIVQRKHPLDNTTQECVQPKKQCTPNSSPVTKYEGSTQGGETRSLISDAGVSEKSLRKKDFAENGPVSTPPEILQDKKFVETVIEKGIVRQAQVNSRKSSNKKVHNLPSRSSKRLAGHEPDQVANLELGERALISANRKSRKTETFQDAHLTSDDLVDGPSTLVETRPEAEFADNVSSETNNPGDKDPLKKRTEPLQDQVSPEELHHKLETEKANDNPEPQLSFLFGSDPCLEFAFKTLIGELPLDDTYVNGSTPTNTGETVHDENLLGSGAKKSSTGKGRSRNKPKNKKELNLPRRLSKRLAGGEPEPVVNTYASDQVLQNISTKPRGKGAFSATDFPGKPNQQLGPGPIAELANQLFTNSAERLNRTGKSFEDLAAHSEPQTRETGMAQLEKPVPTPPMHETGKVEVADLSFSIADYWSDPCLDFAFKTLTGVIPIEDSLVQGYFQEQVDGSKNSKNGSTLLPDYGSPSLFQSDVSLQFDAPEKSSAGQQGPVKPSLLPASNVSFSSCSGVHSQQQSLEGNKDLQQKVKS